MKRKWTILAVLLVCVALAGCSSSPVLQQEVEPAESTVPTVAVPETGGLTEHTQEPTEPTQQTQAELPFEVSVIPVTTGAQNPVTVRNADEFIAAIAPDTEIIVDAERIDFSKARGYGTASGEYYRWAEAFDGPELFITGVSNLTVRGSGEDHNTNVLSAVPRYANVLNFENCCNITVKGLTAGHTEEPGSCIGGVLFFLNSQDILIEDCGLFGCGTLGVNAMSSKNIQIVNNDIYECSVGGVEFTNCDDVNVDGNTFRDLGGPEFRVYGCGVITCNGEPVHDFSPRR